MKLPPITKWQNGRADKDALDLEYYALKDETKKVEQIKRDVADILHSNAPKQKLQKSRGMKL